MNTIKERTSRSLVIGFQDANGAAATPTSVSYRVDCETTRQPVHAVTAISPLSASVSIVLSVADNTLLVASSLYEIRKVTIAAVFGDGLQVVEEFRYSVQRAEEVV